MRVRVVVVVARSANEAFGRRRSIDRWMDARGQRDSKRARTYGERSTVERMNAFRFGALLIETVLCERLSERR